jgi:hypothetical protein
VTNYMRALGLGTLPRAPLRVWYPPRARRYKAMVRASMQGLGFCGCGGAGCNLSDAAQAQSAVNYAAIGAKAGTLVPGIGNIVGAVAGLVLGAVLGRKKPVRASGQQVQQCRVLVQEYQSAAAQSPNLPLPIDLAALKDLNWCLMALYGPDIRLKDPRFFDGNFLDLVQIARNMVRAIFTTPIGATVNIAETVNKIGKQTFRSSGLTFANPPFTNLQAFARDTFLPVAIAYCQQTAGKGAGGCSGLYNRPEFARWLFDLLGFIAATELPQIPAEDLNRPAPEAPAAPAPLPTPTLSPPSTSTPAPPQPLPSAQPIPQPIPQAPPAPVSTSTSSAPSRRSAPAQPMQAGLGGNMPLLLGALGAGFFLMTRPEPRRRSGARRRG